jgi:hypothetical protein
LHFTEREETFNFPYKSLRFEDNIYVELEETGKKTWTGFIWLRTEASGGLL